MSDGHLSRALVHDTGATSPLDKRGIARNPPNETSDKRADLVNSLSLNFRRTHLIT